MGERGHTIHALGAGADALSALGQRLAILGTSDRWTSFVPTRADSFDGGEASRALDGVLLHVWFDDDHGVTIRVYASGAMVGELSLPGDDDEVTASNLDLIEKLEALEILTKAERIALLKHMADVEGLRDWTLKHGVEQLLALPSFAPLPPDATEDALLALLPASAKLLDAAKVEPGAPRSKRTATLAAALGPIKDAWSAAEKRTLALHCSYWAEVWSMNNFSLYNRYKKHLRADERPDVDRLCDAVARGDSAAIQDRVKSILARIWEREDWDKVIRDPKLVDGDQEQWQEWRARLPH